jgi:hypothetical protein
MPSEALGTSVPEAVAVVDGSSPSEGSAKAPHVAAFSVRIVLLLVDVR